MDLDIHIGKGLLITFIAVSLAIIFALIWMRRYWFGIAASSATLAAIFILVLAAVSWKHLVGGSLAWNMGSGVVFNSSHGVLRIRIERKTDGVSLPSLGVFRISHVPDRVDSLYHRPTYSVLAKWPFIEEKLGFQLAYMHEPGDTYYRYALVMPHWLAFVLFCPWFPLLWCIRYFRRRRMQGFPLMENEKTSKDAQTPPA